MANPKFHVGDHVSVLPDHHNSNVRPGMYTIVKVMPLTGPGWQYRAKNNMDPHERVLDEVLLHPVKRDKLALS